jgi:hypothetical protein
MWYIVTMLLVTCIILLTDHMQVYDEHIGGSHSPHKYLKLSRQKLKQMFDHQISYKTKNGSWLSVSFANMKRFNKDGIWNTLVAKLGPKKASDLYPRTYMLPSDIHQVMTLPGNNSFILKKVNSWARQGLKIVDDKQGVIQNSQEYDLVQILIPNPHLINGYKYDFRMFLVVHYQHGIMLFKESYFSYSNKQYDSTSPDMFARIGGTHLLPSFYAKYKLPKKGTDYPLYTTTLYPKITAMLTKIFSTYPTPLLTSREIAAKRIKVFGIDVNIFKKQNGDLRAMLIEMNSNPSLLFHEADWKSRIIYNMLVGIEQSKLSMFTVLRDR